MYNPQLETFLHVADAGSFNKAAEESFITPTAVIKQINSLEESLGVRLFDRSHRGLTLTKAGRSMYQDARYIIQYCRDSVTRAKNAMQEDENIIRIGSSPMTPAQLLMDLWSRVQALHPDIKFQIVPFENTPENAREILANLGKNIDIVGGIFDETMLHLRGCAGLELTRGRFCCAVSIHHRLADKDKLQVSDLYGENLLLMHRGWSHYVDQLRDDLKFDVRVQRLNSGPELHQELCRSHGRGTDTDDILILLHGVFCPSHGVPAILDDIFCILVHRAPSFCELQPPVATVEELHAEGFF